MCGTLLDVNFDLQMWKSPKPIQIKISTLSICRIQILKVDGNEI